jgi:hypothetical protein
MTAPFSMSASGLNTGALGGGGLSSGLGGLPLAALLGGSQGGAGNSALAAALGLPGLGGAASGSSPEGLLRALLNRSAGAGLDGAAPAADDLETRIHKLNNSISAAMTKQIEETRQEIYADLKKISNHVVQNQQDVKSLKEQTAEAIQKLTDRVNALDRMKTAD